VILWLACSPAVDFRTVFPYVYTPQDDLLPYEEVRWETEDWDPTSDFTEAGQYLVKAANHRKSAPDEELAHYDTMRDAIPPLGSGIRLTFTGDTMWVGKNWDQYLTPAASLQDGDLRVGNLETPVSPDDPTELDELPLYAFNAPVDILAGLPMDVLQLANNHMLDVGNSGLEATVSQVEAHGFQHTGVDAPPIVTVEGHRVALLTYTWGVNRRDTPTTHDIHIVPFGHLDEDIDLSGISADIAAARADGADTVITLVHWGYEYEYYPDPHFLVLGREIVALGADVIVGTGPHVVQPPEWCHVNPADGDPGVGACIVRTDDGVPREAAILYSLGNFGTLMPTLPCEVGIVATVSVDGAPTGLGWTPAIADTSVPEVVPSSADEDVNAEIDRLSSHIGAGWRR
jgi:hypothetical protein